MSIRGKLRRLERLSEGQLVSVPQPGAPPARFPHAAPLEAFAVNVRRVRGEAVEPHPLAVAAARSPSPEWRESFYAESWPHRVRPPKDLSEGAPCED